ARLYRDAFAQQPGLADAHCYNAARSACLAGCGQGKDATKLDDKERSRWRQQALEWLRADLTFWANQVHTGKVKQQAEARKRLRRWQCDADLAGVQDERALARLPEAERRDWKKLWSQVAALLQHKPPCEASALPGSGARR